MVLLITLALWLLPVWAQAATYYVATTGNNNNAGTEASPWLTVFKAVDTMVAGDTTYVRAGTYTETSELRFKRSGTASAPITLSAYPGEAPVIRFANRTLGTSRISIWNASGYNVATGWIVIQGLTLTNMGVGVRMYSAHDITIRNNKIYDNHYHGILGAGIRVLIEKNIIHQNGEFADCAAGIVTCNKDHGIYLSGNNNTVINNVIYNNLSYGIQLNANAVHDPTVHATTEYSSASGWIIASNTIAYNKYRSGIVVWGSKATNARIENNIIYENAVSSSSPNGIDFSSCCSTGVQVRNNHFYASAPGGTAQLSTVKPADLVNTGNVVNVSAPAFVTGGSGTLPGSPDFRLTASAPVNIARTNEFPNNSTAVVGAFRTIANPTASITAQTVTYTFSMTNVPVQVPSTTGLSVGCTGANCPGSPTVSTATRKSGTDTQVSVVISGIASNACVAANQTWTMTYNSATGSLSGFDNIGPYPGLHQKVFSHTSLAVTNLCDGTGPPSGPGTPLIWYKFDEGTGTTATNSGSAGASKNGTLTGGATFATGGGVVLTGSSGQYVAIPHGSGIDPSAQNMTIAFGVEFAAGVHLQDRTYWGSPPGTDQRLYISGNDGFGAIGVQTSSDATPSERLLSSGRNHFCLTVNATSNIVTLYVNGVASTQAGGVKNVTSYVLSGNWELGRVGGVANGSGGTFTEFLYYESVEDCASIYAAWNPTQAAVGTFGMPAYKFQEVHLRSSGANPVDLGTPNTAFSVIKNGAIALLLEIYCENIANCEQDSFRLENRHNGTGSWIQVPDSGGDVFMWGVEVTPYLNTGAITSRLSATSCTVTDGVSLLLKDQIPVVDLPQDGCTVNRYIIRFSNSASGYYEFRVSQQNGTAFAGTVTPARVNIIDPKANGGS